MINPIEMLKPCRKITGISAILLPFTENQEVDWDGFSAHVARTAEAGITPAINMDTGYANLIDEATRREALAQTQKVLAGKSFTAGAFVGDKQGDSWNKAAYLQQIEQIQSFGGTPIIFQSFGLTSLPPDKMLEAYAEMGKSAPKFIAFELGTMFAPFGKIYDLQTYTGLLQVEACIGAKHSSLNRELEWQRIQLRDEKRPDFKVFTGNDLAIDMVMYGSDYLLGLSTFAPDLFAKRDAYWQAGDPAFYELNDKLQYLGFFAFRQPVPAYKHSAAQFLKLRGWIQSNHTHPKAPKRPESDNEILHELAQSLGILEEA